MIEVALQEAGTHGFASILPPLLAIGLAIYTRQVFLSLAAGIWLGHTILSGWTRPPVPRARSTARSGCSATRAMRGSSSHLPHRSSDRHGGGERRDAGLRALGGGGPLGDERPTRPGHGLLIGIVVFIESNLTILVAGSVSRPLFDRFRISREKLAYIVDSTSAPVCILIPFNAWGALVLGILTEQSVANPLAVFLVAIPLNLYAVAALILAGLTAFRGWNWGPMKKAEARTQEGRLHWDHAVALADPEEIAPPPAEGVVLKPRNMLIPIAAMVVSMPIFMWVTGNGSIADGSGTTSVLWAVLTGLALAWMLALGQRSLDLEALSRVG